MNIDKAIRILDESTTADEIAIIKYIAGFDREYVVEQIQEAMNLGAEALRKQVEMEDKIKVLSKPLEDSIQDNNRNIALNCIKNFCIGYDIFEKEEQL